MPNPPTAAINWFEIPARDLDRAQAFYEAVLGRPLQRQAMGEQLMAVFPYAEPATGGCLMQAGPQHVPGTTGPLVYLDASPSLDQAVARVGAAGGRVAAPRVALPDGLGAFALIEDTEGNRVGLHALG